MLARWQWLGVLVLACSLVAGGAARANAAGDEPGSGGCAAADAPLCALAAQVDGAARAGDVDALLALVSFAEYVCPAPAGSPATVLCNDDGANGARAGFLTGYLNADASVFSPSQLRGILADWLGEADVAASDEYGDSAPRLFTLGCTQVNRSAAGGCHTEAVLVLSAIARTEAGDLHRRHLILRATVSVGAREARIIDAVFAVLEGDDREAAMHGGPGPIFTATSVEEGTYIPWIVLS